MQFRTQAVTILTETAAVTDPSVAFSLYVPAFVNFRLPKLATPDTGLMLITLLDAKAPLVEPEAIVSLNAEALLFST
jgi:hypothetical protein